MAEQPERDTVSLEIISMLNVVLHLVAASHCSSLKEFDSSLSIISVVIIIIMTQSQGKVYFW